MKFHLILSQLLLIVFLIGCKEEKSLPLEKSDRGAEQKPNIVLFLADDQGWGDLGNSGNTDIHTPNIDALAKYGVSFENFYVQPVCSPTRAELLTGRHYPKTGVYSTSAGGERMDYDETTLAEILREAGYSTAAFGKWHNGMQPPYHPNAQGFEEFYGFASGHWGNYFSPMLEHNGKIVKGNGYLVDDLTNHALEFIEKNKEEAFFLYMPYNVPHSPMHVPDKYWDRYKDRTLEMTSDQADGKDTDMENFHKAALAMVENIDYNVGRIMSRLRKLYLEDDTIIIYMTDNGPNSFRWNGGMRGRKGSTDEGGTRSPFYMQWSDSLPQGKKIDRIASAIDILPTLASLVGVSPITAKPIDGRDLTPLLFEDNPHWPDRIVYNHWNGRTSLRTQNFRLDAEDKLYDISQDRGQSIDISTRNPELTDSLKAAKMEWIDRVAPKSAETDDRAFTLGHPSFLYTQLPARDGIPHGNIERSNKYPNDSYFENWTNLRDSITWDVEVLADGHFAVDLYYTVAEKDVGAIVELGMGKSKIAQKITEAHDPPLRGMEHDRYPRQESYVKDFKAMTLGTIVLKKGRGLLTLKALEIPGQEVADIRLLQFRRVE